MTGIQAIHKYLETHRIFSRAEVVSATGISPGAYNQAVTKLKKQGLIAVESRNWRTVIYRLVERDKPVVTASNIICQECCKSPVMQRILMVCGRVGV